MKIIRKISVLCLLTVFIINCIGCKKTSNNSVSTVTYTESQYDEIYDKYMQLKNELAIYDDTYKTLDSFKSKSVIQAGIMTFNKVKDKIVLDNGIANENNTVNITSLGQETKIQIGGNITIDGTGWTIQPSTSELDCSIPNKASGKIKFLNFYGDFDPLNIEIDWLNPFLDNNGLQMQSKREIFHNNSVCGEEVTCAIDILDSTKNGQEMSVLASSVFDQDQLDYYGLDNESNVDITIKVNDNKINARLRSGLFQVNNIMCEYEFIIYDNSGKLLVDNLINSITINNKNVYLK